MRYLAICGALVVAAGLIDARSTADAAAWCLTDYQGVLNCGFTSFEQCLASRSGVGGRCERNYGEAPSVRRSAQAKKKKQALQAVDEGAVEGGGLTIGIGVGSGGGRHGRGGKPRGNNCGGSTILSNCSNTLPPGFQ